MADPPAQPHDALFKQVFRLERVARSELPLLLPPGVACALDLARLEVLPETTVDRLLGQRRSDVVYRLRARSGGEAYVHLLYEHQSTSPYFMALRLADYALRLQAGWLADHPEATTVPPVYTVVLYHGPVPWGAPTDLRDLLAFPPGTEAALAPFAGARRYRLFDLGPVPLPELQRRPTAPLAVAALLLLKAAYELRTADELLDLLRGPVRRVLREERRWEGPLEALAHYALVILRGDREEQERFLSHAGARVHPEFGGHVTELYDQFAAAYREQWQSEGLLEGQRKLLLHQLDTTFGPIPATLRERVETAAEDDLRAWATRVPKAASLEDVFAPNDT